MSRNGAPFGAEVGKVVQFLGRVEDCEDVIRAGLVEATGSDPVDEDFDGVVDTAVLWWRDEDGDLIDALLDAITLLDDGGSVWLATPKAGREGHVDPADISEAGRTAGLRATANISVSQDSQGTRFVPRR